MREYVIQFGRLRFHAGKWALFIWLCFLLLSGSNSLANPSTPLTVMVQDKRLPEAFWKRKPQVLREMQEDRRIVVSATTEKVDNSDSPYQMAVVSAGYVKTPMEKAWAIIKDFEQLPKVDDRFQEAKYDPVTQQLDVHAATLGYHARMKLKLKFGESQAAREIHFHCVEGSFQGMTGIIRLEDDRRQQTEISMTSDYRGSTLPLPKVLMGVGLEIVASRVAGSMRTYIETATKGKP